MKALYLIMAAAAASVVGCASLNVGGSKEPIKVDIAMRVDVYQHVQNDINAIEDMVSGSAGADNAKEKLSFADMFMGTAYAEEGLSPEVQQAALRRKGRLGALHAAFAKGAAGESKFGLVAVRDAALAGGAEKAMIDAENSDRMIIYKAVAAKNGTSVDEVQKMYAKRLQSDAPSGTPVETDGGWKRK